MLKKSEKSEINVNVVLKCKDGCHCPTVSVNGRRALKQQVVITGDDGKIVRMSLGNLSALKKELNSGDLKDVV